MVTGDDASNATNATNATRDTSATHGSTGLASCVEAPAGQSGVYLVAGRPVLCDAETDGGGWTLVYSSRAPPSDFGGNWSHDLTTLAPRASESGPLWNGLLAAVFSNNAEGTSDFRVSCRLNMCPSHGAPAVDCDTAGHPSEVNATCTTATSATNATNAANATNATNATDASWALGEITHTSEHFCTGHTVDLAWYDVRWYTEIASGATDADVCFEEDDGNGATRPTPKRCNLLTGECRPEGAAYGGSDGYLEAEDDCAAAKNACVIP